MTTSNVEYLREHGPTPYNDLPSDISVNDKRQGLARINLSPLGAGKRADPVAYLFDEHDAQTVVEVFIDANAEYVEAGSYDQLVSRFGECGSEFQEAAAEALAYPGFPGTRYQEIPERADEEESVLDRVFNRAKDTVVSEVGGDGGGD